MTEPSPPRNPHRELQLRCERIIADCPEIIGIVQQVKRFVMPANGFSVAAGAERFPSTDWDRATILAVHWALEAKSEAERKAEASNFALAVRNYFDEHLAAALERSTFNYTGQRAAPSKADKQAKAANTAALLASLGLSK